ncbi:MAG: RNA polymerase sigma-70 factor [Rikenellaceae bacterium]
MVEDMFSKLEDVDIIKLVKRGNTQAFTEVYNRYHKLLYVVAYRYLRSSVKAEDAVQHTFVRVWERRELLNVDMNIKNYLFTITKNHVLNTIRNESSALARNYEISQSDNSDSGFFEVFERDDMWRHIHRCIDSLPEPKKSICLLKIREHLSNKEIANNLGLTIDSVKSHYYAATRQLREMLGKILILLIFTLF